MSASSNLTGLSPNNPLKYLGPNVSLNVTVSRNRAPTGADYRQPETGKLYPFLTWWLVGKDPVNGVQGDLWYLSKIASNVAYWLQFNGGGGGGSPLLLTVDVVSGAGVNPVIQGPGGAMQYTGKTSVNIGVPVFTRSTAMFKYDLVVQQATSSNASDPTLNGICHFSNVDFGVDNNGYVTALAHNIEDIQVQSSAGGAPNPVLPSNIGTLSLYGLLINNANIPIQTITRMVNQVNLEVQVAAKAAASDRTKNGLSHFDSAAFDITADGFVTFVGDAVGIQRVQVQNAVAPGVNPVIAVAGTLTLRGVQISQVGIPIQTISRAANTINIEVQRSGLAVAADVTLNGICHFSSADFAVDVNGFVTNIVPAIKQITLDSAVGPGTNPILPVAGNVNLQAVLINTSGIPIRTISRAANTANIEVQVAGASVATDRTLNGMSHFDSAVFTVSADGFVTTIGGGAGVERFTVQAAVNPGTNPVTPNGGTVTINGALVVQNGIPVRSISRAANTINIETQISAAVAGPNVAINGLSHFDSAAFLVSAEGFVTTLGGGAPVESFAVQAAINPGTNPVTPNGGVVTLNGALVVQNGIPIRSISRAANTVNIEAQISATSAAANTTINGMCHFDSAVFTVSNEGFVTILGAGAPVERFAVQASINPGTNPVTPSGGTVTLNAALVAQNGIPLRTISRAANTVNIEGQISATAAASDITINGLCHFNSANFTVDANGFVSAIGGGGGGATNLTGDDALLVVPTSQNINLVGIPILAGQTRHLQASTSRVATSTMQIKAPNCALFIVDANALYGTHTTIQSAINDASLLETKQYVFIRPGTYTENLTIKPTVSLVNYSSDQNSALVSIIGAHTVSAGTNISCTGLVFENPSGSLFTATASPTFITFINCCFFPQGATGFIVGSGCNMIFEGCVANLFSSSIGYFSITSGAMSLIDCIFYNTIGSTVQNTVTSGNLIIIRSIFQAPITSSGACSLGWSYSQFETGDLSAACYNAGANISSNTDIIFCEFTSGVAPAIICASGNVTLLQNCTISSVNASAVTGAGELRYTPITFSGLTTTMTVTTQTPIGTLGPRVPIGASACHFMSGSGSPSGVVTAPRGSVFVRSDSGVSVNNRAYINTNGSTGWTAFLTAS